MTTSISTYNQNRTFTYDLRESRLKKCARLIDSISPGKMLDIGCSAGDWLLHWQAKGWLPYGIDIDRKRVNIALDRGIVAKFCDLNSEPIPFGDSAIDLVFAGEVIEHLIDTDGFISEVCRVLKPNGRLLLTTPSLASFENRVRLLFGIYPIWMNYNLEGQGHVRYYTPRVLRKQLSAHGFRVLKHIGNWVPFIPQRFADDVRFPILAITGDCLPSLSMDIIMLAQKIV